MEKLTIDISPASAANTQVVKFTGDFDGYAKDNVETLKNLVEKTEPGANLIFDFTTMNYLNSYAIGHLVNWYNKVKEQGGKILIVGANKNVEEIFSVLGIDKLFETFADMAAAENSLK